MNDFIISFTIAKSTRKNAKCNFVDLLHYERTERDVYTEFDDVMKIHNTVEKIIVATRNLQKTRTGVFHIAAHISFETKSAYISANKELYQEHARRYVIIPSRDLYSLEKLINYVYDLYMICNPGCTLSIKTVFENPSIRYLINDYYNGAGV